MGLCQPRSGAGPAGRHGGVSSDHEGVVCPVFASPSVPAGDRQLLGFHPHRRRLAHAGGAALPCTGLHAAADRGAVPVLRSVRGDHQPGGRLPGRPSGAQPHHEHRPGPAGAGLADAHGAGRLADGALGDGRPGAVRHRQGPQQDECQKHYQTAGSGQPARHSLPMGCPTHGLEKRAQGRGVLPWRRTACPARLHPGGAGHGDSPGLDLARQPDPAAKDLGKAKAKPKFRDLLSKSRAINLLSGARLFLFGARDVWFVVHCRCT